MNNIEKVRYLRNLKTERKILRKNMNLYYFQRKKRKLIFSRLEKIEKEIERVEKNENNNLWATRDQKKSQSNGNGKGKVNCNTE